jgi:hypothetical protein
MSNTEREERERDLAAADLKQKSISMTEIDIRRQAYQKKNVDWKKE